MSQYSVVIPSRNVNNLVPCVAAVWQHEPDCRIIVVDDGLPREQLEGMGLEFVQGVKPFVFARNVNLGIQAAGQDDVILLNDDALLQTSGGFTALSNQSAAHLEYGVIASSCNNVGNANQHPRGSTELRDESRMVCFVCVYIPRHTIETVGLLNEEFTGYGFDDDSYCFRVREAGLKLGIYDGCFVDHKTLHSTYRTGQYPSAGFEHNRQVFIRNHGHDNWGKTA